MSVVIAVTNHRVYLEDQQMVKVLIKMRYTKY